MKLQTNQTTGSSYQNLSEIGRILANAICRLEAKKIPQIRNNQLDSNFYPSVHGVSNNLNQNTL